MKMDRGFRLTIALLNGTQSTVSYRPDERVEDVLKRIVEAEHIDLVYGYLALGADSKWPPVFGADIDQPMEVALRGYRKLVYRHPHGGPPRACNWQDYILCASLRAFEKGVSWRPTLSVCFKWFRSYTPNYAIDCAKMDVPFERAAFQNMWSYYLGKPDGVEYRFTQAGYRRSLVMLLELREDLDLTKLDAIRYNVFGVNHSYYGGEYDSWQRYTEQAPIPCIVKHGPEHISVTPTNALRANRWHALVLLNTPISGGHQGIPSIYDDHLIPFLPSDVSACQRACYTFLMHMKRRGGYASLCGKIICRYYVWPFRFDEVWAGRK